jgi:hypothetical protein
VSMSSRRRMPAPSFHPPAASGQVGQGSPASSSSMATKRRRSMTTSFSPPRIGAWRPMVPSCPSAPSKAPAAPAPLAPSGRSMAPLPSHAPCRHRPISACACSISMRRG